MQRRLVRGQAEVVRVALAQELQGRFHGFFACELGAGQRVEHVWAVRGVQGQALLDACFVCVFQLEPPVGLELAECWLCE